ncbi:eukaryotic translation elongation factor 1 delta a (guanine nucleotide exchange protein) isoform X1 [Cynoglossus semilaevis]|uniref:Eukaryotic translation elongation factor 1 delta a (guanine nucleotide exchange protein) n=2 Tax=Cynoglossus semilaevis TaxID=244447 RepID=A0A3P8VYU7_CYNSE|nr:elongation factor 1-delta-like isoform X1 [Cynoglossus semilaevis]XP_024921882.1 elongation factor 1-delta-like isoform X1 [Cynoglossus semilaevis]XP_024921883.1 elongation factor 1-delta-like isoform X1 [Cynoglossus semilaevis]XP_024921884.1 elongation factor 1-delta-like isoform X1 [Cynoglossus semilaevis]
MEKGPPPPHVPGSASRQGNAPTFERSIISGDNIQFGRLRRRTRLSQSESQSSGAEEEWLSSSLDANNAYGRSPVVQAMQVEGVWYNRSSYDQAENNYQRRLTSNNNGPLSSSPRSPNTRGSWTFNSRRGHAQQQDHGPAVTTVKASGTPHRQSSRGRNRTSSETEQGSKGTRGPHQRKRGFSETESRPKWDNTKMSGLQCLAADNIWFDKQRFDDAERRFYEGVNGPATPQQQQVKSALQQAKGRQHKRQHRNSSLHASVDHELVSRMKSLELENQTLHKVVEDMRAALLKLETRVAVLEKTPTPVAVPCAKATPVKAAPAKVENGDDEEEDDDDIDLFGSDEDNEAAERLKQERLAAYAAKKAKKPALIAKSSILLDVKPWDDETDMGKLEEHVRSVQMDGLLWGASKLVPVGYGIKKLQINCVVEDDKVGTDILEEEITKFEDFVQSVDVAAFNKI